MCIRDRSSKTSNWKPVALFQPEAVNCSNQMPAVNLGLSSRSKRGPKHRSRPDEWTDECGAESGAQPSVKQNSMVKMELTAINFVLVVWSLASTTSASTSSESGSAVVRMMWTLLSAAMSAHRDTRKRAIMISRGSLSLLDEGRRHFFAALTWFRAVVIAPH